MFSFWVKNEKGDLEEMPLMDTKEPVHETLGQQELIQQIQKMMAQLPSEQKEALVLREYHDFSYDQIAVVLNCSLEKVKILIYRARTQLQQTLPTYFREGK